MNIAEYHVKELLKDKILLSVIVKSGIPEMNSYPIRLISDHIDDIFVKSVPFKESDYAKFIEVEKDVKQKGYVYEIKFRCVYSQEYRFRMQTAINPYLYKNIKSGIVDYLEKSVIFDLREDVNEIFIFLFFTEPENKQREWS